MEIYKKFIAEIDSQPKNPPQKRLSKKEFYKLLERDPSPLITNPFDEKSNIESYRVNMVLSMQEAYSAQRSDEIARKVFSEHF